MGDSLASAPLDIDQGRDSMQETFDRRSAASPAFSTSSRGTANGSINERLDRFAPRSNEGGISSSASTGGVASGIASALRMQTQQDSSARMTPTHMARNASASSS